jgi:hypothetical protein
MFKGSRDTAAHIVTDYGQGSFLGRERIYCLHHCVQTGPGPHPAPPWREADQPSPFRVEIKNSGAISLAPLRLHALIFDLGIETPLPLKKI